MISVSFAAHDFRVMKTAFTFVPSLMVTAITFYLQSHDHFSCHFRLMIFVSSHLTLISPLVVRSRRSATTVYTSAHMSSFPFLTSLTRQLFVRELVNLNRHLRKICRKPNTKQIRTLYKLARTVKQICCQTDTNSRMLQEAGKSITCLA